MQKNCSRCGTPLKEVDRFCAGCGAPVQTEPARPTETVPEFVNGCSTQPSKNPSGPGVKVLLADFLKKRKITPRKIRKAVILLAVLIAVLYFNSVGFAEKLLCDTWYMYHEGSSGYTPGYTYSYAGKTVEIEGQSWTTDPWSSEEKFYGNGDSTEGDWEIVNDKTLCLDGTYYEFSLFYDEDSKNETWFITPFSLRIGEDEYTRFNPVPDDD